MSYLLDVCPVCAHAAAEEMFLARDRHYGIAGEYRIVRCGQCGLVYLNPMYSDAELSLLYPDNYYAHQDRSGLGRDRVTQFLKRLLGYAANSKDPKFPTAGRVLDIGCGSGWFLQDMRQLGWEVFGVEINSEGARVAREIGNLDVRTGTVQDASFPPDYFDYIRMNHSFEHMSCPNETLEEVRRILKPTGKLMIGVPNIDSLNARAFGQHWWYLGAPVHTFSYSPASLSLLLQRHWFCIEMLSYNSDYSGVLGSLQIWLNRRSSRLSTDGALFNCRALRLLAHYVAKLLDMLHTGDAIEIVACKERP